MKSTQASHLLRHRDSSLVAFCRSRDLVFSSVFLIRVRGGWKEGGDSSAWLNFTQRLIKVIFMSSIFVSSRRTTGKTGKKRVDEIDWISHFLYDVTSLLTIHTLMPLERKERTKETPYIFSHDLSNDLTRISSLPFLPLCLTQGMPVIPYFRVFSMSKCIWFLLNYRCFNPWRK